MTITATIALAGLVVLLLAAFFIRRANAGDNEDAAEAMLGFILGCGGLLAIVIAACRLIFR